MRNIFILPLVFVITGCTAPRQIGYTVKFMANRPVADYDRIEQALDREVSTGEAEIAYQPYWTGFRGPNRDGVYAEGPIRTEWPLPEVWRRPCGAGFGSVILVHQHVITLEQRRDREAVVAYDLNTGRQEWIVDYPARFKETMSGEGPRSTPEFDGTFVYSLGAEGRLCCIDPRDGRLVWQRDVLDDADAKNLTYGLAASPLVVGDTLVVAAGDPKGDKGCLLAYDRTDGSIRWQALPEEQVYASPALYELDGRSQLVVLTAEGVRGLDPANGSVLWRDPWHVMTGLSNSQPVQVGPNRILLTGGYGKGSSLLEIKGSDVQTIWSSSRLKTRFNTVIYYEGYIYGLDEGILVCLDAATGKRQWKSGRYGYGQLLRAGKDLVLTTQKGELCLIELNPERHIERARFPVFAAETLNTPAIGSEQIVLRNGAEIVCYSAAL